jgi:hypothetical protein
MMIRFRQLIFMTHMSGQSIMNGPGTCRNPFDTHHA